MTGSGHRWTGIGAAFFAAALAKITGMPELVAGAVAAASTTVPDWIEFPYYRKGVLAGRLISHRTITHWPPLWVLLGFWACSLGGLEGAMMLGVAVGALVHILGDAPNPMGIPWLVPHQRIRFGKKGWWRSGQKELLIALTFATFGFAAWRLAGGVL